MKNKILIPLLIVGALAAFFSFKYIGGDDNAVTAKRKMVLETLMKALKEGHYSPRAVDDSFSIHIYNRMLDNLDYDKKFFTQAELNTLGQYKYKIDDEINNGSLEFYDKFDALFLKSIDRAEGYYKDILKTPFTFTDHQQLKLTGDDVPFPANETALKERWKMYLKYRVLAKYVDLKEAREKDTVKTNKKKTDAELEADARESVRKNMDNYFKRLHKIKDNDRYTMFINSITDTEDPHTAYLPPREKAKFDELMSGSFVGIGAQLSEEDGKIKVAAIVTGSPCWKQGELKAGDEIQKVAQGSGEPVDIQGMEIEDVITLIRGKAGTEVRLTVKKVDNSTKIIGIIRGEVLREETFAKSALINTKEGKIGYIYLPEFYADFNHLNGRRCAEDVAIEVKKLMHANVKGIILDLRYNGGGSLNDVVDMSGLFIDQGPIVQVKSSDAAPVTLKDDVKGSLYDGPMVIMVNSGSASASEIMAAAMQDYKRAVIVGTTTYGKGTVQKIISLDDVLDPLTRVKMMGSQQGPDGTLGSLKITMQKFYRVNGGSTQRRGVTPDITLPDPYAMLDQGERKDKAALPWDEIPAANYKPVQSAMNIADLNTMSKSRIAANPVFGLIQANAEKLKRQQDDNTFQLSEADYKKELDESNATAKKIEELEKKANLLEVSNPQEDMAAINRDSASIAKNNDWLKGLKKDIYLSETVNILSDLSKQTAKMNMGTGMK